MEAEILKRTQEIVTERYLSYFHKLQEEEMMSEIENGTDSTKEYFYDFQIYQQKVYDCLVHLVNETYTFSGTSPRRIKKWLQLYRNEPVLKQMFEKKLPIPNAVKECIYRFYHIDILLCPRTLQTRQYSMDEQDKKKIESTDKHRLHFRIEDQSDYAYKFCNRVKILVNRVDILQAGAGIDYYLGLLPGKMLQTNFLRTGKCLIGMCHCGDEGCAPYYVNISINDDIVTWDDQQAECQYKFDKTEYELAIKKLQKMLTDYLSGNPYKPTEKELEEFKKEIYSYLTQKLGASIPTANELMKGYEIGFEQYLEEHWSVSAVATAMWHGF